MRKLITGVILALMFAGSAWAGDTVVSGYTRKDGTYVAPYHRSTPNNTTSDNYSTRGNVNPYTGAPGTKPDTHPSYTPAPKAASTSPYSSPTTGAKKPCTSLYGC